MEHETIKQMMAAMIPFNGHLGVADRLQVLVHRDHEPQGRVHRVVLRLPAAVGEAVGQHALRDEAGPRREDLAGVRVAAPGRLNLYYRFAARAHGRGYGSEAARAVTAHAAQWLPEATVEAVIRPGDEPSIRTARRAPRRWC